MEIQNFLLFSYYIVFKLQLFIVVTIVTVVQLNCCCYLLCGVVQSCAPCGVVLYSLVHLVVWCCTVLCTLWCGVVQSCAPCGVVVYSFVYLVVWCCTVFYSLWCCVVLSCAPCGVVLYSLVHLVVWCYIVNTCQMLYSLVHLVVWCCTVLCTFWCRVVQSCAPCGVIFAQSSGLYFENRPTAKLALITLLICNI